MSTQERRELADELERIAGFVSQPRSLALWLEACQAMRHAAAALRGEQPEKYWAGDQTGRDPATELNELRRAVATTLGEDPETWPSHGNAPLAIAATVALQKLRGEQPVESGQREPGDEQLVAALAEAAFAAGAYRGDGDLPDEMAGAVTDAERALLARLTDPRVAANREAIRAYEKATAEQGK